MVDSDDAWQAPTGAGLDSGSFVLTAFGRSNAGTIRGDRESPTAI
jgi:hypothetical protein